MAKAGAAQKRRPLLNEFPPGLNEIDYELIMIQSKLFQRECCKLIVLAFVVVAAWHAAHLPVNAADSPTPNSATVKPANITGKWQIAWDVRLGTVRGIMDLKQKGNQVTGTFFEEITGLTYSVSGSLQGKDITFDVPFPDSERPYMIEFKGIVDRDKMTGTSAMKGSGQVFLGHAGEVDEPQRPWTALKGLKRELDHSAKPPKDDDD